MRSFIVLILMITAAAMDPDGHIVQFVVHAHQADEVSNLFPGASIQSTWNNIMVVQIWTHDPDGLIAEIKTTLDKNSNAIQTIIPPFTLKAATQKWIEYNLSWIMLLLLIFVAGCACGGIIVNYCATIKSDLRKQRCRTGC